MPTGGGESLCYQGTTIAMPGLCLVVSPLIALMKDQVESLRKKGITAFAIYSGMSRKEVLNVLTIATESNCKFLYVSPERLESALFKEYLPALPVSLLAVDEAHCISQWGYDFRPPYLRIAALREELPHVPVLALTASATPGVQQDICERLSLSDTGTWNIFRQPFSRPNLSYSAFLADSKVNKILEILQKVPGSSIIYCRSRKRTQEIAALLQLHGISCSFYHAGLGQELRSKRQEDWISNRVRVIACTNAFGMGIDKPDVRTVIHADVPESLENYYQEAGRAGRDGKRSYTVLLFQDQELADLRESAEKRFPPLPAIREVYQAIANYLQMPPGSGQGEYMDFDFTDFLKKFKLDGQQALYTLKVLEQDGWIAFNEQVFLPPTVQFTITKEYLYRFEKDHPALEPLIKALLRAYEGIYDYPAYVSEQVLARLLHVPAEDITKQLHTLHQAGVIDYAPRKDKPQLYWMRNRIRTEELTPDLAAIQARKFAYISRVEAIIQYALTADCRSVVTGRYFGDKEMQDCGICDNCLRKKNTGQLTPAELKTITEQITALLHIEPLTMQQLTDKLVFKKEKLRKALRFMEEEGAIGSDEKGRVRLM